MQTLNLRFEPVRAVSTWLEAPEFRLVLENPTAVDVPIRHDWYAGVRIGIFAPDGTRAMIMPFGEPGPTGAAPDDEIFSRSDRERRFTLPSAEVPGLYVMLAKLDSGGDAMQASATWFLEAPGATVLAISSIEGLPAQCAWILSPGVKQATLLRIPIAWSDFSDPQPLRSGSPERLAVAAAEARGLVAGALPDNGSTREYERVAWLSGNTLHVGVTAVLFDSVAVPLPGPARCILAPLLICGDGTIDAFVLSEDGLSIWVYRGRPAIPRQPPVYASAMSMDTADVEEEPENLETAPLDDEEEDSEPAFDPGAEVPAPELVATLQLPFAASHGSVGGVNHRAIVVAADAAGSIDVQYLLLDASLAKVAANRSRIVGAQLIPGCNPWVEVDQQGRTWAAVLFHEPDPGSPAVGLAKLAFDGPDLVWREGVGRQQLAMLDSPPLEGALAGTGEEGWHMAWCVRTAGDKLVGSRVGRPSRSQPVKESLLRPLLLLASAERLAVGAESGEGITFVNL